MNCEYQNRLLDLYFSEASELELSEIQEHVASCDNCRSYIASIKETLKILDQLENEAPSANILNNILAEVLESKNKPDYYKLVIKSTSILKIVVGQIFLCPLIYLLKIQLTQLRFWSLVQNNWLVQLLGNNGIAFIILLIAGSFITLSIAPILLLQSYEKRNLAYK